MGPRGALRRWCRLEFARDVCLECYEALRCAGCCVSSIDTAPYGESSMCCTCLRNHPYHAVLITEMQSRDQRNRPVDTDHMIEKHRTYCYGCRIPRASLYPLCRSCRRVRWMPSERKLWVAFLEVLDDLFERYRGTLVRDGSQVAKVRPPLVRFIDTDAWRMHD